MSEGQDNLREERRRDTQRATAVGALINLVLSVVKIAVGYSARSQSLIADGIHSLSDLVSDALVWWAAHHASQAPDAEHPYGHGRFETAATLGLGLILVLIAGGIVYDAAERMLDADTLWQPQLPALFVALASVLSKEALYWYTVAVARRIRSDLLKANAWHHRSDAVSSIVVLVGIAGTLLGLPWFDAAAAVVVGLMVAKVGWDLGWGAIQELVDASIEAEKVDQVRRAIGGVNGVRSVHMLRTRRQGHEALADVHVQVEPWVSVSEGHMISMAVENQVKESVDEISEVTVHIDPEDDEQGSSSLGLPLRDQALSELEQAWRGVQQVHRRDRILLHYLGGHIDIELFLPLACFDQSGHPQLVRELNYRLQRFPHYRNVSVYYG
jgi:cation diffusion facilitator family transporter